jgi:eukaryotic-like serine/threonine-protein kinase
MPTNIKLEVIKGAIREKEFLFEEHDTFVFGREPDCQACLPGDNFVSRHHFLLEVNPPDACVRDLGSMNGTYVNGRKIGGRQKGETPEQGARKQYLEIHLIDGDEIKVGETRLLVRVHSQAFCCQCGDEIPEADKKGWALDANSFLCGSCREKQVDKAKRAPKPSPVLCSRCGKDAAGEIGQRRGGEYLCAECRAKAAEDPWRALQGLLEKARLKRNGEPAPAIEGYEIVRQLGIGGYGAVYLARRKKDGLLAAVKVMLARVAVQESSRKAFLHEMGVLKSLRHPNIVLLLEHGAIGSAFYFVMEYCDAGDVADLITRRGGRVALAEATAIMLLALDGLAYAHTKGIVHRDLKPGNLLLAGNRANRAVKVSDFGLAKNFEQAGLSGMTLTGHFAGTPLFMPREQVLNFKRVKPVSDVWSFAATFYFMLTGVPPRETPRGVDPLAAVLGGVCTPIRDRDPSIPKALAPVIDRALAVDHKKRFQNATEFRDALAKAVH